jgi:hypothetical protein
MIDLIDDSRKIIFRFDTDIQSAAEEFCIEIGHHYSDGGAYLSSPSFTAKKRKYKKYTITCVKTTVNRRGYKFELGSHIIF